MSSARTRRLGGVLAVALAASAGVAATSSPSMAGPRGPFLDIQILSFNDFHGNLEGPTGSSGTVVTDHALNAAGTAAVNVTTPAGGVEYLATHLRDARVGNPNTVTVAAGDIIGASPLLSAAFHDEPTIEAMNALGSWARRGTRSDSRRQRSATMSSTRATKSCNGCSAAAACPTATA
jgi:5'-nucleotidase